MVRFSKVLLVGLAMVVVASCSSDDEPAEDPLTSTSAAPITTLAEAGTATAQQSTTTTTTTTTTAAPELSFPQYSIISREAAENGDIVVVLLDAESYESLSDLDVLNVMSDLVEQFAPVYEAHIVETQAAADALFVEEPTEDQQTALANGYVARLEQGFRIVYEGSLEDYGVAILGS
jgi:hypothetical protein